MKIFWMILCCGVPGVLTYAVSQWSGMDAPLSIILGGLIAAFVLDLFFNRPGEPRT